MNLRPRIKDCVHLGTDQVKTLVAEYRKGRFELGGQHGAAVQYYLRQFLYLPYGVIAEVFGRKPWHVRQTIDRMVEGANESRTPVTMNADYQGHIEQFDDYCREHFGVRNVELASLTDDREIDYLLWESQKKTGRYEDTYGSEPLQHEMWMDVFDLLNVSVTEEVVFDLCESYTITRNA